ncbi:MAG: hypothetical protein ABGY96_13990 [bacterium]|nr:hypothetical protein [Gammaproteobacteria bacterium]HIL96972.1 hypothetical protein [Pseudomonadales bacterium]
MTQTLYQVIFSATMTGEFGPDTTKQRFEKLFGLDQAALKKLFSGRDLVIKKNLSEEAAMQFALKVAEAGCECVIESMLGGPPEQRKISGDRRTKYRRDARPSSIVPDRRIEIRRQEDAEYFEELILNDSDIPVAFGSYPTTIRVDDK